MNSNGDVLKFEGMDQVAASQSEAWHRAYSALAEEFFSKVRAGESFSGEDVHQYIETHSVLRPSKPQAWSAKFSGFIRPLLKEGRVMTVDFKKSMKASNHSRFCRVYQRVA